MADVNNPCYPSQSLAASFICIPCNTKMNTDRKLEGIQSPASLLHLITEAVDVEVVAADCDH